MKQFLKEDGVVDEIYRSKELSSGSNVFDYLDPGSLYISKLSPEKYSDFDKRHLMEYIYLSNDYNPNFNYSSLETMNYYNYLRTQRIEIPQTDGNVNVTWKKFRNYAAKSLWDKYLNMVKINRDAGFKCHFDTISEFGPACTILRDYTAALRIPGNKILHIPAHPSTAGKFRVYNMDTLTYEEKISNGRQDNFSAACFGFDRVFLLYNYGYSRFETEMDYNTFQIKTQLYANGMGNGISNNNIDGNITLDWGGFLIEGAHHGVYDGVGLPFLASFAYLFGNITYVKRYIIMPDGKHAVLVPRPQQQGIYILECHEDGWKNLSNIPTRTIGTNSANALLANEKILVMPAQDVNPNVNYDGAQASLYDVYNKSYRYIFGTNGNPGNGSKYIQYNANCNLPDGRCLLAKEGNNYYTPNNDPLIIYDPFEEDDEKAIEVVAENIYGYSNAKLLMDGRVVLFPSIVGKRPIILSNSNNNYGFMEPDEDMYLCQYLNIGKEGMF